MINNNLSSILGERLLKISTISKETGISRSTLTSLYYKRSCFVSFEVLNSLCKYLKCQVNDIISYED